eukprot:TRINITY_DN4217_c1_g1_i12.p1 TRINITY_DN4217_c1_g1~~TRINITY_DN4217_c1_g1_i12.p1  ORF type:complete len:410 (+),score=89.51 TRINITY_DN4217_c1_g1_i12:490-1719(+)
MSSLYNFVKRHRRKFVAGGVVVGGAVAAIALLDRHITKVREDERKKQLEIIRKRNHFDSTDSAVAASLKHYFAELKSRIAELHDTSQLKEALRQGPDKEEKIRLWNEMKNLCFGQAVSFIIAEAFLAVLIRVQLNILAGYLYSTATNNNEVDSRLTQKFQEAFLSLANYFVQDGFQEFTDIALLNVKSCVAFIQLQDEIGLDNVENIFSQIQDRILSDYPERNLVLNPGRFLLSSTQSIPSDMTGKERELYKEAISETLEIMESQEVLNLMTRACRRGFSLLIDKIAEPFLQEEEDLSNSDNDISSPQQSDESGTLPDVIQDFVSPCRIQIPLVKILPELSSVLDSEEGESDNSEEWLQCLLESPDLKTLGANVYESFSAVNNLNSNKKSSFSSAAWNFFQNLKLNQND